MERSSHCRKCDSCSKPAVVELSWSDRQVSVCLDHIPLQVAYIALDHSYDRGGIHPNVLVLFAAKDVAEYVESCCQAARDWLDRHHPDWAEHTVRWDVSAADVGAAIAEAAGHGLFRFH